MRLSVCRAAVIATLAFAGCAYDQPRRVRPEPPRHYSIEGSVNTVSQQDIYTAITLVRKDMKQRYGSALSIYRVMVIDHSRIQVWYWPGGGDKTGAEVERVKGRWKLSDIERVIIQGINIPTNDTKEASHAD